MVDQQWLLLVAFMIYKLISKEPNLKHRHKQQALESNGEIRQADLLFMDHPLVHLFTLKTSLVVKRTRKHGSLFIEYLSLALKTKNSCQFIELNYEHNVLTTTTIGMR